MNKPIKVFKYNEVDCVGIYDNEFDGLKIINLKNKAYQIPRTIDYKTRFHSDTPRKYIVPVTYLIEVSDEKNLKGDLIKYCNLFGYKKVINTLLDLRKNYT